MAYLMIACVTTLITQNLKGLPIYFGDFVAELQSVIA